MLQPSSRLAGNCKTVNMECIGVVMLVIIGTILSPNLTTPSAGALTDYVPRDGMCDLSTEERLEVQRHIQNGVTTPYAGGVAVPECGPGVWFQIADFDVSDTSNVCPGPEWEFLATPVRACRRMPVAAGCSLATFPTGGLEYSKVCGQIIGRGVVETLDSFNSLTSFTTVDGIPLVDGVTVTNSSPIQHIWTLAASSFSLPSSATLPAAVVCPCNPNILPSDINTVAENFADGRYFCDTTFGISKPLWNGDCSPLSGQPDIQACCEFNNPPFFSTTLPTRTSDDVEARLCRDQARGDEDFGVEIIQLYVQ